MNDEISEELRKKIMDVFGKYVTEQVRDRSIHNSLLTLKGHFSGEPQYIVRGYNKLSDENKEFFEKKMLPYLVDNVIFYFLSMLESINAGPFSLTGKELEVDDYTDDALRFALQVTHGNKEPFPIEDLAVCDLAAEPLHSGEDYKGWNERFGKFPSSNVYNSIEYPYDDENGEDETEN